MTADSQENEVKFYLTNPEKLTTQLSQARAQLKHPRCHETDLRFDNDSGSLQATLQVLRLRKDSRVRMTYKGPGIVVDGVSSRREIEVIVSDFDKARELLESLGYHPCLKYEKFRTTYNLNGCEVVLDEMPYGWFCEIEGLDSKTIQRTAAQLNLQWENRITDSYVMLFDRCREILKLNFADLTFSNFKGILVTANDLGVKPADI